MDGACGCSCRAQARRGGFGPFGLVLPQRESRRGSCRLGHLGGGRTEEFKKLSSGVDPETGVL